MGWLLVLYAAKMQLKRCAPLRRQPLGLLSMSVAVAANGSGTFVKVKEHG